MNPRAATASNRQTRPIGPLCAAVLTVLSTSNALGEAEGHSVPHCTLTAVGSNKRLDLRQLQGKVVYVDFWASWCGPCAQSFPFMNTLDRDLRDRGLRVVGINLDEDPADAQDFLSKRPARFAVAMDADKSCAQSFGVQAMPSTYVIDRKGVIRHVHLGFRPGEADNVRDVVERLLAENP